VSTYMLTGVVLTVSSNASPFVIALFNQIFLTPRARDRRLHAIGPTESRLWEGAVGSAVNLFSHACAERGAAVRSGTGLNRGFLRDELPHEDAS
jgi:hypothetical protein